MLNFIRKFVASKLLSKIPLVGKFANWLATAPGARRIVALCALTVKLSVAAVASVVAGVCAQFADLVGEVCKVDVAGWASVASSFSDKIGAWLSGGADLTALVLMGWSYLEAKAAQGKKKD